MAALEQGDTAVHACIGSSHVPDEPSYLEGDGWITPPFLWKLQDTVAVLSSAQLRLPLRADHGSPGRVWVKLLPEEASGHGPTLRYPARWDGTRVEAVLPEGTWRASVVLKSSAPLPLGTVKLCRAQPTDLPGTTLRPGSHLIVQFEPDRGVAIPPDARVLVRPAAEADDLSCAAAAGTLELISGWEPLEVGDRTLWSGPESSDVVVLLSVPGRPTLLAGPLPVGEEAGDHRVRVPVGWGSLVVDVPHLAPFLRLSRHAAQLDVALKVGDTVTRCATTVPFDAQGVAISQDLAYGTYDVRVAARAWRAGHTVARDTVSVTSPLPTHVQLDVPGLVQGRVEVGTLPPVECLVTLNIRDHERGVVTSSEAWTDRRGSFAMVGLPEGDGWAHLRCLSPATGGLVPAVRVSHGESLLLRLGQGKITGTVVNTRGIPQAGRTVWASWLPPRDREHEAALESLEATTDERGTFRFTNLAAGRWRLETRSPRNRTVATSVEVGEDDEQRVTLTDTEGALRVRLLDPNGQGLPGVQGQVLALPRAAETPGSVLGEQVASDAHGVLELPWASETVAALFLDLELPSGALFCTRLAVGDEDEIATVVPAGVGLVEITFANPQQERFPQLALTSESGGFCDLFLHWAVAPGRSVAWSAHDQRLLLRLPPGLYRFSQPPPGTFSLLQAISSAPTAALPVEVVAGGTVALVLP